MKGLFLLTLVVLVSCGSQSKQNEVLPPAKQFALYTHNPDSTIVSRVRLAPAYLMDYLRNMDGNPGYQPYQPDGEELKLLEEYLNFLPDSYHQVLKDRLLGIYFIKGLQGTGLADYVTGPQKQLYTILILNEGCIRTDISEWLTYRESSCFIKSDPLLKVEFRAGNQYKGLLYGLFHEMSHVYDYVTKVTPYVEPDLAAEIAETVFTKGIWKDYSRPTDAYNIPWRKDFTFYGFGGGPKLELKYAEAVYKDLTRTPFVSIYASKSWAEDYADSAFWYLYTMKLKQPFSVAILSNDSVLYEFKPEESPPVLSRLGTFRTFFK